MEILFTSDLHGRISSFQKFAEFLKDFDCGVIAGDLKDDYADPDYLKKSLAIQIEELKTILNSAGKLEDRLQG